MQAFFGLIENLHTNSKVQPLSKKVEQVTQIMIPYLKEQRSERVHNPI